VLRIMKYIVPIGLLVMLVGCSSAVQTSEPKDTTPEPSVPTFLGTWKTTSPVWHDDEIVGTATSILTFTNIRYIQYTLEEESDGTYLGDWAESGTWRASDTAITRTWVGWDDDNQRPETEPTSVAKQYTWAESGDVLFMAPWDNEEETETFARYVKVDIPDPYPLAGSWNREVGGTHSSRILTQTFTFNDTFTFAERDTNDDDEPTTLGTLTGTWRIGPDNFILVTVESASGGNQGFGAQRFRQGQILKLGYAPTNEIGKIQISPYWREQMFDSDQLDWIDTTRLDRMYGNYTFQFTRGEAAVLPN